MLSLKLLRRCYVLSYNSVNLRLIYLISSDYDSFEKFCQKFRPLIPETVCSGQRSVSADDHKIGDRTFDQVLGGLESALPLLELHATGRPDHGAALVDDTRHGRPVGFDYMITPVNHALVAFLDKVDLASQVLSESEEKKTMSNQSVFC